MNKKTKYEYLFVSTIVIIFTVILLFLLSGCQTSFDKNGKIRSISIARNVYMTDCGDCETMLVNTTDGQTKTASDIFKSFFNTLTTLGGALIPRGITK